MSRFLLYLPALACPLLMLVCLAGMRRMGGMPERTQEPPATSAGDRIARLEGELAELRAEQQHASAEPGAEAAPTSADRDPPSAQRVS